MKRPDQYRLDVDEAGATDYKQRPDTPNEAELNQEEAQRDLYDRLAQGEAAKAGPPAEEGPAGERERGSRDGGGQPASRDDSADGQPAARDDSADEDDSAG